MSVTPHFTLDKLIQQLSDLARERLPATQVERARSFFKAYYHRVPTEDLEQAPLDDLYGAALAHLKFAQRRVAGNACLRIYNPTTEVHGWQTRHSVVEIVVDDMAFLVDSIRMALNRLGHTIHLTIHPVISVERDPDGTMVGLNNQDEEACKESFLSFQLSHQTTPERLAAITQEINRVLAEVRAADTDWEAMRDLALATAKGIHPDHTPLDPESAGEVAALCHWIADDHFTFLGAVEFDALAGKEPSLVARADSALGILRPQPDSDLSQRLLALPSELPGYLEESDPLLLAKSSNRSLVHRPAYMDLIAVRHFDAKGQLTGETCLLGLFSAAAYTHSVADVPVLRLKLKHVLQRSGLPENGHGIKVLQNLVESYPRDDLFQIGDEELYSITIGMLELQERQRTRLFQRRDRFGRFYSCLVFVPRDRFNSDLRQKIGNILLQAYAGHTLQFDVHFSDSVLARIHYLISVDPEGALSPDTVALEQRIAQAARSWREDLHSSLETEYAGEAALARFEIWGDGFPTAYQEEFTPQHGACDLEQIVAAEQSSQLGIELYRERDSQANRAQLKLYSPGAAAVLSDVLPVIENMGLRVLSERPYRITSQEGALVFLHVFDLEDRDRSDIDVDDGKHNFETVFQRVWSRQADNDGFNRLVLRAGLDWKETTLLRAAYRYLRQLRFRYSQDYVIETLAGNPHMAIRVIRLFHARFDPDLAGDRTETVQNIRDEIAAGLERVTNLDEDRILSAFVNLIESMLRTSYFQDHHREQPGRLSFKIDCSAITRMPRPRPMAEIFVYSSRVEAIHLRGGKVARGGLRWSDRPEDFRTEVLGLVKAQIAKNAVIIPVGSKGGFIARRLSELEPDERGDEVRSCYQTFIRGLLDLTDNRRGDSVIPPPRVVRYDEDDPYLVVAADKGTATFSDLANDVAAEYDYWLDDAFASGGKTGYDHKAMGITARGAWESVKRLFRDLDVDTQAQPFTVLGIGDMSGDVFGNGMLLSPHIRLIGAFNHEHIFIDPHPDPKTSFKERERLFRMPRSTWADYDLGTLSAGGGIWPRTAKSIELTESARKALGIGAQQLSPTELIHEMIKSPADLLFNGGIGTYIKASTESHESVGDRVNDALRVDASQLRCRVIGEGGNLGLTQLGRIEFSHRGGLCHTDAIDNSAGVDTSDHEVNIKILLSAALEAHEIDMDERNTLLEAMTEEVALLVLRNNYAQTQALALAVDRAPSLIHHHSRAMRQLERSYGLDRELEHLPGDEEIAERISRGQGLTRPELAVLLAHSKISTYQILLESDVPEDPFLGEDLQRYFPQALSPRFDRFMAPHRLRREIIATHVTNSMINRVGSGFTLRMNELTGGLPADTARAYAAVREIFRLRELWREIEALDHQVASKTQKELMHETRQLLERATAWMLRHRQRPIDIAATVAEFRGGVDKLRRSFPRALAASNRLTQKRRVRHYLNADVPATLANHVAALAALTSALDIADVANSREHDIAQVATVYFDTGDRLGLHWLSDHIRDLPITNHWHALARSTLRSDLHLSQRTITANILDTEGGRGKAGVRQWVATHRADTERLAQMINDLQKSSNLDFAMLSVAVSEAGQICSAPSH